MNVPKTARANGLAVSKRAMLTIVLISGLNIPAMKNPAKRMKTTIRNLPMRFLSLSCR
jgi:hypothetical protein